MSDREIKELRRKQTQDELKIFVIKTKDLKKYTKLKSNILMKEKKS